MREDLFGEAAGALRRGDVPVHQQIEVWFMDAVARGDLAVGDRLPPEHDLAGAFGVSRMTLRQALGALAARGVVRRRPGRAGGTFVAEPTVECDLTGLAGFTEQLRRAHVRAGARIVAARTEPSTREVALALGLARDAPVHLVVRVRTAHRRPLALERSYFPADHFPDLLDRGLSGSLYAVLRRAYGQEPTTATEVLEPVALDGDEARLLGVDAGTAVMLVTRTAYSASGHAVEYARDLFRPDRVRITVRSVTSAPTGRTAASGRRPPAPSGRTG